MRIDELWRDLEVEGAAQGRPSGLWITRRARPVPGPALLIALEPASGSRAILIAVEDAHLPPRREWPECRGLDVVAMFLGGGKHFGVRLRDRTFGDVFTALAEDVASKVGATSDAPGAMAALLGRLQRWQRFLAVGREGLGAEAQRGLWAELHVLVRHVAARMPAATAVAGWKAPGGTHQDFQFPTASVEVKGTSAKQPHSVRINSERQLDATGTGRLFLHVVILDERDVPEADDLGTTLPGMVHAARSAFSRDAVASGMFEDRLLAAGWLDADAPRYEGRRWTVRVEQTYAVTEGFPRITETTLPPGIGSVSYELSLAACRTFLTSAHDMLNALAGSSAPEGARE
jgi:hypothetical protein